MGRDGDQPVKARKVVSARDLARSAASLLDEVQETGMQLLIVRRGKPTAFLIPAGDIVVVRLTTPTLKTAVPVPDVEVDDLQERILMRALDAPTHRIHPPQDLCADITLLLRAMTMLELKRLMVKTGGSYTLTHGGLAWAQARRGREGRPPSEPPSEPP